MARYKHIDTSPRFRATTAAKRRPNLAPDVREGETKLERAKGIEPSS